MGQSPFRDAIEALENIKLFCERREKAYEGWAVTPESASFDLRHIREKAEEAIKSLTPANPNF